MDGLGWKTGISCNTKKKLATRIWFVFEATESLNQTEIALFPQREPGSWQQNKSAPLPLSAAMSKPGAEQREGGFAPSLVVGSSTAALCIRTRSAWECEAGRAALQIYFGFGALGSLLKCCNALQALPPSLFQQRGSQQPQELPHF